jgi:hypothetical protein
MSFALLGRSVFIRIFTLCVLAIVPLTVSSTPQGASDGPHGLIFELGPSGFTPSEVTVNTGKYVLLLENRSGQKDLTFTLERENGSRMAESNKERRDWKATVQLSNGSYILSEASHPEWRAVIRVNN